MKSLDMTEKAPMSKYLGVPHEVWLTIARFAQELGGIDQMLIEIAAHRKREADKKYGDLMKLVEDLK